MPAGLPPEVIDRVIGFVRPCQGSLCNCALTCRAWLPASRYNLFRGQLTIRSRFTFELLIRRVLLVPHMQPYLQFVKGLTLCEDGAVQSWAHLVPHHFVGYMPQLDTLHLHHFDWFRNIIHPSFFMAITGFAGISTLELVFCRFNSFCDFERLMCALPRLTDLHLAHIRCARISTQHAMPRLAPEHDSKKPVQSSRRPYLKKLTFIDFTLEHFTPFGLWLMRTPSAYSICSFHVCVNQSHNFGGTDSRQILGQLLRILGGSLTSLTLPLIDCDDLDNSITLEHNFNLRSLRAEIVGSIHGDAAYWPRLTRILSHATTQLRSLCISLQYEFPHQIYAEAIDENRTYASAMRAIDTLLNQDQFIRVERMEMALYYPGLGGCCPACTHAEFYSSKSKLIHEHIIYCTVVAIFGHSTAL